MDSRAGLGSDQDLLRNQLHSNNDEWDLPLPPNRDVGECLESSWGRNSESESGEATALDHCSYEELHALHDHGAVGGRMRRRSGGAVSANNFNVGGPHVHMVEGAEGATHTPWSSHGA
jgi:hypothetical protein